MKVYIIGITGMLGSCLFLNFINNNKFHVKGSLRLKNYKFFKNYKKNIDSNTDVKNFSNLKKKILIYKPDYVINCVGWIKQKKEKKNTSKFLNSKFPHLLNNFLRLNNIKLIHFSTDCVFSGKKGNYEILNKPDSKDLYGISKSEGEVLDKNCLTIRTSIIGHEINSTAGLLEWFLSQKKTCLGFNRSYFSGLTTYEIYKFLIKLINSKKKISGIFHLSSKRISKYALLKKIKKIYKLLTLIKKDSSVEIDRSLSKKLSLKIFNYYVPSWDKMIIQMKNNRKKIYKNLKLK